MFTSAKKVIFLPVSVCLSVCGQDNSKSYGRIFLKFWGYVGRGINYKWFNFGRDPTGIPDSGSLWNFRYRCVKGGIREPLQNRRRWRHLANSIALAEVPAGYDCFLVVIWCARTELTVCRIWKVGEKHETNSDKSGLVLNVIVFVYIMCCRDLDDYIIPR